VRVRGRVLAHRRTNAQVRALCLGVGNLALRRTIGGVVSPRVCKKSFPLGSADAIHDFRKFLHVIRTGRIRGEGRGTLMRKVLPVFPDPRASFASYLRWEAALCKFAELRRKRNVRGPKNQFGAVGDRQGRVLSESSNRSPCVAGESRRAEPKPIRRRFLETALSKLNGLPITP
jgi:hypothetical protein